MKPDEIYELARLLTSPVVAVTSRKGEKRNGMITDGVVRASIVPDIPRFLVLIHKLNLSHDLIYETGAFGLHILHEGQVDVVTALGFVSGRDKDKMAGIPHRLGPLGMPILEDHVAAFECEVINAMDSGSSTIFLGEGKEVWKGTGRPMSPFYLRDHLPADIKQSYAANLTYAQDWARARSRDLRPLVWRGLRGS